MPSYLAALTKYAIFSGRASRKEFWSFTLINVLLAFTAAFAAALVRLGVPDLPNDVAGLWMLAFLLPSLSVSVRRLHDTGRTGWWVLLMFVPLASLALLVFMAEDTNPRPNRFGESPKLNRSTA